MKRGIVFVLLCVLLQGIQILCVQECVQKISSEVDSSLRVCNSMLCVSQECVLHECQDDRLDDLSWLEWMQKICESLIVYMNVGLCKMKLYIFSQNVYKDISLLQEKLAENFAELGYIQKSLWYSQEGLHSSVCYLAHFAKLIDDMQFLKEVKSETIERVRDQIIQYSQHVQSHIITITDFASDEKETDAWRKYESVLMRYFEKMQQVMQSIDTYDELLCNHDAQCYNAAHHDVFENCMNSDFDPDEYD